MTIRPYRPSDEAAVREICIRTAQDGGDATPFYTDPQILPELFVLPYAALEPDLAFVVDDGERAVGYVVGTPDTAGFARRFRAEWLPPLARRYPAGSGDPTRSDAAMVELLHRPEHMVVPELAGYPAHLHICLLSGHQRAGHGRRLIATMAGALRDRGVPALFVGMVTANVNARAFYDRVGFHVIDVPEPGPLTYLGLRC